MQARGFGAPDWIDDWVDPSLASRAIDGDGWHGEVRAGTRYSRVTLHIPRAASLDDEALSAATLSAYQGLQAALPERQPVRIWNGLPGILDAASAGRDRYMVFNAGRHAAFDDWFGAADPQRFASAMPAATGVGIAGEDLVIDCLADRSAGCAIENPRQTPAHRYSMRYGPRPPCFSRATRIDDVRRLLISGTASIVGETSLHADSFSAQFDETLVNLDALVVAAGGTGADALKSVRAYHLASVEADWLHSCLRERLPEAQLELQCVVLCRPDLAIEIEGVAIV